MTRDHNSIFRKFNIPTNLENAIKTIIPIASRKKIKSYIGKFLVPAKEIIPSDIKTEWENNNSNKADIINFSVISWDLRYQRPQQISHELAKNGHRVFYIEHEFLSHPNPNSKFAPIQVIKKNKNIYQIIISASRELFIYQEKPSSSDQKIIIASIKNLIKQAHITNPIGKIDHPFWGFIVDNLSIPFIYDCMDNHSGFKDSAKNIDTIEKELVNKSNKVIVTSKFLENKINQPQKTILVPNGVDFVHFNSPQKTIPEDIKNIKHPIIGYYGAISHWLDLKAIEDSLSKHPDKSFVFIGKIENQEITKLKYKNLFLLGEKPYSEIPKYLNQFDVALIPFLLTPLIKATNPVKIYEYFSAGKKVVSTKLPELIPFSDNIFFSSSNNFSDKISLALKSPDKASSKITIAKNSTWTQRTDLIEKTLDHFFPKVSVIILSYNHPDLLKKTIESVVNRSFYPNMEIIIVDNNSDSETKSLLNKYKHLPNFKIIFNNENYGFAKGNNIGLKAATGDYLILLNNDVIVTPGWISRLLFHVQKSNVGLVGPVTNSIGNEAKINIVYDSDNQSQLESAALNYTSAHWGETLNVNNIAAFCWIMSRHTYNKVGDLDERFGMGMFEDDDYCKRIKKLGLEILIADDVFIHHFGGSSFKELPSTEYEQLFKVNKNKFESKWKAKWIPHQYRK